ncbi:hypothetical protein DCAR_0417830 [Daucus carota subsp. sativus]|uniref:Uncharacterized protein n=1 Tax=Daucus carota subsp. sativus TaxID=79200 RepID=A0A165YYH5_DAUCS|nr:hypothetical protein DCAR_0417830 [Daucus carota subsp. sativus]
MLNRGQQVTRKSYMLYDSNLCCMALKIASAETGRAGGGRGWRRQSIRLLIRLTTGRHQKKINPICPITPPVNATMPIGSILKLIQASRYDLRHYHDLYL